MERLVKWYNNLSTMQQLAIDTIIGWLLFMGAVLVVSFLMSKL